MPRTVASDDTGRIAASSAIARADGERDARVDELTTRLADLERPAKLENPGIAIDDSRIVVDPRRQPILAAYRNAQKELDALSASSASAGDEPAAPAFQNEAEPNDTVAAANALTFGSRSAAKLTGSIDVAADVDFYSFTATAGARVWIHVDTGSGHAEVGSSRDSIVDVFDTDGTTILESDDDDGTGGVGGETGTTGLASVIAGRVLPSTGTYYIRVGQSGGTASIDSYRLYVYVTSAAPTTEAEPNDSAGMANTAVVPSGVSAFISGTLTPGDRDFYSISLQANDVVLIAVDGDPDRDGTSTSARFQLRDTDGTSPIILANSGSASGSFNAEGLVFSVPVTGIYFVRVSGSARSTTGDYTLLVDDTDGATACVITCPPNQTAVESPEGSGGAVVNYPAPTTTGDCLSTFCSPASGSTFPVGTTTVTCQEVIGKVGGTRLAGCTFTVTVTRSCVVTCPPDQMAVESPEGSGGAVVNYPAPTTTGGCFSTFCSPASGSTFPVGTTTVTCQEIIGRPGGFPLEGCTFTVTVTQACTGLTCPASITVANDPNQCSAVVNYTTPSGSGCGTVTCSPASGTAFPVGTTTVTCSGTSGATCSFTVTVNDTQPPSITCPASLMVSNDPNQCGAVVAYPPPTASDNCPGVTTVCAPPSGSFFPKGATTGTCTATDAVGNTATCSFTVTVNDTQPPSIACPAPITTTGTAVTNCMLSAVVTYPTPTVSDNGCAGTTVICSPPSGSTFAEGTTTVTCTARDASGNTNSCSFAVTVGGAGLFGACFVDDYTGDTWSIVTDPASPLYRYWRYRVAATGEVICGTANYLSYAPNHSLVAYDNDDPRFSMNANVSYGTNTATVVVNDRSPIRRFVLRDRNIRNDPPCQ